MSSAGLLMPKKKKPAGKGDAPSPGRKQYNVGFSTATSAQIDEIADALGLDPTNFLRMVVTTSLPAFRRKADAIRRGDSPE